MTTSEKQAGNICTAYKNIKLVDYNDNNEDILKLDYV